MCERLLAARDHVTRAVTCTTRPPRPGEVDGVHYHFLDPETFRKRVEAGAFLEHATVFGKSYGTLKSELLDKLKCGRDVLLSVDVQGAASIRARAAEDPELRRSLITVFLAPPSIAELERRLRGRNQDAEAVIQKRLGMARQEIAQSGQFDYVILSASPDADVKQMLVILDAEKLKQGRVILPSYS